MEIKAERIAFVLKKFRSLQSELSARYTDNWNSVISSYKNISENLKIENKKSSTQFNALKFFNIGETLHSQLFAFFLNPEETHGQDNLFLNEFLKLIGIEFSDKDKWVVTAEVGRIDVLIRRINSDSDAVIVIENKSNYAVDQPNQIYRYWLQEMYFPNKQRCSDSSYTLGKDNTKYRIIYLSPSEQKQPTLKSLIRPTEFDGQSNLPVRIELDQITILKFDREVIRWLKNCINKLDPENHRMREYINQYIELWEK